ncbi:ribonuclease H-like domain-containing protein [Bradyrhizobium sp. C9]|uniref:ribonuclease H-like domain-containing protein n=1 Tax=Bradyrhizobium sp. C9 TaxID=142585 RepID=UPI00130412E2|nr:ribonuclease H-like domain-containing protein [Bradyrhizobium sp. C9]
MRIPDGCNRVHEERSIPRPSPEQVVLFPDAVQAEQAVGRANRDRSIKSTQRAAAVPATRVPVGLEDPGQVLFLDVETTGLSWFYDEITLIGWARNGEYHVNVAGEDPSDLLDALAGARTLVTFNGTLFDLRFLRKKFGQISLPSVHIDLRYLSKRVGLSGGQKAIEDELGISARSGVEGLDGAAAVLLWHEFVRGDIEALRRLVDYNRRDVLAMCMILDRVVDRLNVQQDLWLKDSRFEDWARPALDQDLPLQLPAVRTVQVKARTFKALFAGTHAEKAKIVGIDLTGSEKRPSGYCVLDGDVAVTSTIGPDAEMLARILEEKPDLVSIDSPLSLPEGRLWVSDDDPGRDQFGIMRRCERELKRRGINVYPSLLPSMQKLTERGIRLAETIRRHGIPVIESYPGAAQDIMGIPRKGAGERYLKQGLAEFGISGGFETQAVTHDELDAITSAVVGSFFLSGQFEALSGPTEGALIIPDLKSNGSSGLVVGISGRICAGKTTTARLLERRGFAYTRFSLVIDDEIRSLGETPDRATRQRVGEAVHETKGQRWLCERVLDRVAEKPFIVVDGLRFPEDHAFFVERFGSRFLHLHVDAPTAVREHRYEEIAEGGPSFGDADRQPVEAEIGQLSNLAMATIDNVGSIRELEDAAVRLVSEYSQQELPCPSPSS